MFALGCKSFIVTIKVKVFFGISCKKHSIWCIAQQTIRLHFSPCPADLAVTKGWITMNKTDYSPNTEELLLLVESLLEPKCLWAKSFIDIRAFLDFETKYLYYQNIVLAAHCLALFSCEFIVFKTSVISSWQRKESWGGKQMIHLSSALSPPDCCSADFKWYSNSLFIKGTIAIF